jgi:hypothetical protein
VSAGRAARAGVQGIALVTVLVVLVALALIATPFALSMRGLESSSLADFEREAARDDAQAALDAAAALLSAAAAAGRDAAPRRPGRAGPGGPGRGLPHAAGARPAWRGRVGQPGGRVGQGGPGHAPRPSCWATCRAGARTSPRGGAAGGRCPSRASPASRPRASRGWATSWSSTARSPGELREVRRGLTWPSLITSHAQPHDGATRCSTCARCCWPSTAGAWAGRLHRLRAWTAEDIALYGELSYGAGARARAAWLTAQGGAPRFVDRQRVLARHRPRGPARAGGARRPAAWRGHGAATARRPARASGSWCCPPRTGAIAGGGSAC